MTANFSRFEFEPSNGKPLRSYYWDAGSSRTAIISNAGGEELATVEHLHEFHVHRETSVKIELEGMKEIDEVVIVLVYMQGKYTSWIGRP